MTTALIARLWSLAAPANPTSAQMADVIRGWDDLFRRLGLTPDEQEPEFDAIMRARVKGGVISLLADRFIDGDVMPTRVGGHYLPPLKFGASPRAIDREEGS